MKRCRQSRLSKEANLSWMPDKDFKKKPVYKKKDHLRIKTTLQLTPLQN